MNTSPESVASAGTRGRLLSLLAIPAGVLLWSIIWYWGFMASLVALAIAWGAVWLFTLGAGREPEKSDAYWLVGVIIAGVVLSFAGGIVTDSWIAYKEGVPGASLLDSEFWSFATDVLGMGEIWKEYTVDIVIALVFAALGAGSMIRDLLSGQTKKGVEAAQKET